ncbi:hypothetical protein KBZ10_23790 [Streptomyces sp. F63]|uniref:hypothetical protein n=1 Tax=Streptomyces sp. F63 TaxID=2824887 RepID=UPI001B39BD4D|nr:hypothetical protein [Streptomyces sp. F63]MBQ0987486.1 hypothetical protein [Streptomyces sp. F63]
MTAGWCSRAIRTAVFAAVCVLLAALGHVMMSGSGVPAWTLAAGLAATGAAGWGLAGRERGLPLIVTVVVAAQTALHTAFSLAQPASGAAPSAATGGAGPTTGPTTGRTAEHGMEHAVDHAVAQCGGLATPGPVVPGPAEPDSLLLRTAEALTPGHTGHSADGSSSLGMFAAHLLAAVLCGLWLAYGEKAAFRILRTAAGRLAAPLRLLLLVLPPAPDRPRVRARRRSSERTPRLLLVHAITSRGPPGRTAVV